MAALYAMGYLAYNPALWDTAWRSYNLVDAGGSFAYTTDIVAGLFT